MLAQIGFAPCLLLGRESRNYARFDDAPRFDLNGYGDAADTLWTWTSTKDTHHITG